MQSYFHSFVVYSYCMDSSLFNLLLSSEEHDPVMEKPLLLARLAADRARLLCACLGLNEATLTGRFVLGDWTILHMLAGAGEYDALYATVIPAALAGTLKEIGVHDLAAHDFTLRDRFAGWDVARVMQYLDESRAALLTALESVPEEALSVTHHFPWTGGFKERRGQGSIKTFIKWRYLHDNSTREDIEQWRKANDLTETAFPGPKALLMAALEAAEADFRATAALVPESERETRGVCGAWSLKDLLGHMADWDDHYRNIVRRMLGEPTDFWDEEPETDAQNDRLYQARRHDPWAKAEADCMGNRRWLLDRLQTLDTATISRPYTGTLYAGYPTLFHCYWSAAEHYLDHAAVMRRELGLKLPAWLLKFKVSYTD
jgi:hypothetical protein